MMVVSKLWQDQGVPGFGIFDLSISEGEAVKFGPMVFNKSGSMCLQSWILDFGWRLY